MYRVEMNPLASRIALGSVQFGLDYGINNKTGVVSSDTASCLLKEARIIGINTIDTARVYGNSESILGEIGINDWNLVSKFNPSDNEPVIASLEKSLAALKCNHLYGYLSHSGEFLIQKPHIWEELQQLKAAGRIRKTGYSIYLPEHLEQLLQLGMVPDIIQVQYNLFDKRFAPYFEQLKLYGTEIHTRSCFLQGLFFLDAIPDYFKPLKSSIEKLRLLFPDAGMLAAALMRFCLDNPSIDKLVIGLQTEKELIKNMEALESMSEGSLSNFELPDWDNDLLLPYNWPKKS